MYSTMIHDIWPDWSVVDKIGEGTYGVTYKVQKVNGLIESPGAVKVISIPRSDAEERYIQDKYKTPEAIEDHLNRSVSAFVSQMKEFDPFRFNPNILAVSEYRFVEKKKAKIDDGMDSDRKIGWYLLIRTDYLPNSLTLLGRGSAAEAEVIRLGIDICNALEICDICNAYHGNVKPENIFIDPDGKYKLGDYVISEAMEKTQTHLSKKRMPGGLSPENYHGKKNDAVSDLYSLALVMYRFLNRNKLPFQDLNTPVLSFSQKKEALNRRFNGEVIPAPVNASANMTHILQKACAFDPKARYQSAAEFREVLKQLAAGTYKIEEDPIAVIRTDAETESGDTAAVKTDKAATSAEASAASSPATAKEQMTGNDSGVAEDSKQAKNTKKAKKKTDPFIIVVAVITAVLLGTIISLVMMSQNAKDDYKIPVASATVVEMDGSEV